MFEQALSEDAWRTTTEDVRSGEAIDADEQLAGLAQTVALHPPPAAILPAPNSETEQATPSLFEGVPSEPLPGWRLDRPEDLFAVMDLNCPVAYLEQFQLLRTQLLLLRAQFPSEGDCRTICITSALSGEGKTFTARNLAATLATASGKRVLVIETGVREPLLPESTLGLDAILPIPQQWRQATVELAGAGVSLMAGPRHGLHTDFEPLPALVHEVRQHFDWVLIDGPAIHSSASAEWVSATADATLVVVREGGPSFDNLAGALERIPNGRLAGIVMNRMPMARRGWFPRIRIRWSRNTSNGQRAMRR
jgi:Mrp family chromosome partitioning ATPase